MTIPSDDAVRLTALEAQFESSKTRRDAWTLFILVFSCMALIAGVVAVGLAARAVDDAKRNGAPGAAVSDGSGRLSASVHLREFSIQPKDITVGVGATLEVVNPGAVPHNLAVKDSPLATAMLPAGGSASLKLDGLMPGVYSLYCAVPGHEAAGMAATLHVGAAASSTPSSSGGGKGETSSGNAIIDFNATPSGDWHAFDPTLKPADGATTHNVTFHAAETVLEVAPGVNQEMWTFNGQAPGPVLRGHLGDVFNVKLINDGKLGHSIDFHASKVSPQVEMKTLQPGESLVYQFKASYAGIWMYHCGTPPALHHIGNGMYGAVIIDPPDLPAVDHEFVMVQSELYLGPDGKPGDLAKMQRVEPDAVVFNGYVNQYKFSPVKVGLGQRERVWVLDAGPSENSSFHIVGTIFDTVFKEGHYLLQPDATSGGSQALDLQPAQGGFVEFTLDDNGQYPMVTHKFANVGKGALGLFSVGAADAPAGH